MRSTLLLGHAPALRRDPLAFLRTAAASGDVVPLRVGPERWCLVVHPDDVATVLGAGLAKPPAIGVAGRLVFGGALTALDGAPWARRRRTLAAAFHRSAAALRGPGLPAALARRLDGWRPGADVLPALRALVIGVLAEVMLGDAAIDAAAMGAAIERALAGYHRRVMLGVPVPDWLPIASNRAMRRGMAGVTRAIDGALAARRAAPGGDLASRLLAEPDLDAATLRDELAVALALGGHQTTVALAWALALVAAHPAEAAARSDDIVDEALRLYPPFHLLVRHAAAPLALRDGAIPAGTTVMVSPYLVQRDPRWFERPDTFTPGRWRGERPRAGAYLPFGAGPRACVAQSLTRAILVAAVDAIRARHDLAIAAMPTPAPAISLAPRDLRLELRARA